MVQGSAGQMGQFDSSIESVIGSMLSGKPSYTADVKGQLDEAVFNPMMRTFNQQVAPKIQQAFAGMGNAFSSASGRETRIALDNLQAGARQEAANRTMDAMSLNAQLSENAANRQIQGISLADAYGQRGISRGLALAQGLDPFRQVQQQAYEKSQVYNNPWLQTALAFTGQQQIAIQQQPSIFSQVLGGISSLGGAAAGVMGGMGALSSAKSASGNMNLGSGIVRQGEYFPYALG